MTKLPPTLRFSLLIAISLLVGWRSLFETFTLALRRDEYTHILLILPITAALLYTEWPSLQSSRDAEHHWSSMLLVVAGVIGFIAMFAGHDDLQMFLGVTALVTWGLGAFILCFGSAVFLALLFPLCFLFCLVPIPEAALTRIIAFWQQGSSYAATFLFSAAGVPVTRDRNLITIPGLTLEIAQECSSLRSSLMLLVTTMVLAHLFLRSSWRKVVLVLVAIPLSIAKNGVRIFVISMLGTRVDSAFLHGRLHHDGGVVFFLLALLALLLLLWFLGRGERLSAPVCKTLHS